jgi:putative endopeptidase
MLAKSLNTLVVALAFGMLNLAAQQSTQPAAPAPQPLKAMPYSPSLDVSSLDRSVDPCVDFYKFSCGGWEKNNPIPADQPGWSVYAKLANDNQQFLWGILEDDAQAQNRTPVQQKVGDYFAACMNTAAIDALGDKPVQAVLAKIDGLKTRADVLAELTRLHHEWAGSFFFGSGTDQDAADSSTVIVALEAGGLGLPDRDYYTKTDDKSVKIRAQYAEYIQQLLGLAGESAEQAKADADAILRIETALAKASLTRVERRDPHNTYHMERVEELGKLTPSIDWPVYFKVQGAPGVAKLNVSQPEFLKAVEAELTTEDVAALRGYLRFHLLTAAAPYLAHPFEQANFDFYSKTLRGVPAMPPRWKTCTRAVDRNLGEALGQEFVRRTFRADTKAKTQLMTEQIETAMQHEIENLDWMSPATKAEALRKLHAIRNKIGYPAEWRDYSALEVKPEDYFGDERRAYLFEDTRQWHKLGKPVDLNEWGMTPPTVNA